MSRDWTRAFWPASFNGFGFEVDIDELEGGRRISVSEIAYRDEPITEDFGARPRRIFVTAYLASDAVDAEALGFSAALQVGGIGMLVMPLGITGIFRIEVFRRIREKDRNGYIAFDMEFVTAGLSAVPFGLGPIVPRLSAMAGVGRGVLGAIF